MEPSEAEMEGRKGLPMRYNFSPSAAVVGDQLVIASGLDILKELIDGREGATKAPAGTNAGLWLDPSELRALLAANREALIAQSMLKNADTRVEAEHKIDLALDLGRLLRSVSLLSRERAGTLGLELEAVLGPAEK